MTKFLDFSLLIVFVLTLTLAIIAGPFGGEWDRATYWLISAVWTNYLLIKPGDLRKGEG